MFGCISRGTVASTFAIKVHTVTDDLTNATIGAIDVQLSNIDLDGGALDTGVAHVSKETLLILNELWVVAFVSNTTAVMVHRREEQDGKNEEDHAQGPEDVNVGHDTYTELCERLRFEHLLVLDRVLLLPLLFLLLLLLFLVGLEQWFFFLVAKRTALFGSVAILGPVRDTALGKEAK